MAHLRYIQGLSRPTYYRRTLNEYHVLYMFTVLIWHKKQFKSIITEQGFCTEMYITQSTLTRKQRIASINMALVLARHISVYE